MQDTVSNEALANALPASGATKATAVAVKLRPINNSDHPVLANYLAINSAPGLAYLDFGFLEPTTLGALSRGVRAGRPVPQSLDGRLSVRVAVTYETLQTLHQQVGLILSSHGGKRSEESPAKPIPSGREA